MKLLYFDLANGVSGDMLLGSLINLGVSEKTLINIFKKAFGINNAFYLERRDNGFAIKVKDYKTDDFHAYKNFNSLILNSKLDNEIKNNSVKVLEILSNSEKKIHCTKNVHFHEIGALDTLVDIVGTLSAIKILSPDKIISSKINIGHPAPATLDILKEIPVYSTSSEFEFTTPTGAVLIRFLSEKYQELPESKILKYGIGAGENIHNGQRSYLYSILLDCKETQENSENIVYEIDTNIDDMEPRFFEIVFDKLLKTNALDVWIENIIMKKTRPAFKLSCLCYKKDLENCIKIIFENTTTFGMRYHQLERRILDRKILKEKKYDQTIRKKIGYLKNRFKKYNYEYDDIKKILSS